MTTFDRDVLYNTTIVSYPNPQQAYFEVELVNKIGYSDDDESFIANLLQKNNIKVEFPHKVIADANKVTEEISKSEIKRYL